MSSATLWNSNPDPSQYAGIHCRFRNSVAINLAKDHIATGLQSPKTPKMACSRSSTQVTVCVNAFRTSASEWEPQVTPIERIPAAVAACPSVGESPTYTQLSGVTDKVAQHCSSPSGLGLAADTWCNAVRQMIFCNTGEMSRRCMIALLGCKACP